MGEMSLEAVQWTKPPWSEQGNVYLEAFQWTKLPWSRVEMSTGGVLMDKTALIESGNVY